MWTWYASRAAGLVVLVLLTTTLLLGISGVARAATTRWPRFALGRLHRNVSLLAIVFLAVHVATAVLDGYVPIRWLDVVLPSPPRTSRSGSGWARWPSTSSPRWSSRACCAPGWACARGRRST
ncbi:hypothetical protein ACFQV8_33835 [Pseudonocardia benzenivorans]